MEDQITLHVVAEFGLTPLDEDVVEVAIVEISDVLKDLDFINKQASVVRPTEGQNMLFKFTIDKEKMGDHPFSISTVVAVVETAMDIDLKFIRATIHTAKTVTTVRRFRKALRMKNHTLVDRTIIGMEEVLPSKADLVMKGIAKIIGDDANMDSASFGGAIAAESGSYVLLDPQKSLADLEEFIERMFLNPDMDFAVTDFLPEDEATQLFSSSLGSIYIGHIGNTFSKQVDLNFTSDRRGEAVFWKGHSNDLIGRSGLVRSPKVEIIAIETLNRSIDQGVSYEQLEDVEALSISDQIGLIPYMMVLIAGKIHQMRE